jgi:hypothetical protein
MKIAFDNALPDKAKVATLIEASGLEGHWDANRFFDAYPEQCRFISAYDRDELVGVGRIVDGGEAGDGDGANGRLDIVVLPDYRNRDIVGTIFKLLKRRRSLLAKRA